MPLPFTAPGSPSGRPCQAPMPGPAPRSSRFRSRSAHPGKWAGRRSAGRADDPISDARYGLDNRWLSELAAEPAHGDRDRGCERVGVLVPGLFEEVFGAEDGMVSSYERFEHCELLGGEVELPSVAVGGMAQGIEFDAGRAEDTGPGRGLAAGQSADPEDQFGEVEGLG